MTCDIAQGSPELAQLQPSVRRCRAGVWDTREVEAGDRMGLKCESDMCSD